MKARKDYEIHQTIELIKEYHSFIDDPLCNGYNMTIGGDGRITLDRQKITELWNDGYSTLQIANMVGSGWSGSRIHLRLQGRVAGQYGSHYSIRLSGGSAACSRSDSLP